jgi:tetratricopeptide (TPR) repeat protein
MKEHLTARPLQSTHSTKHNKNRTANTMKMTSKNLMQNHDPKLRAASAFSFKFWLCVFCLSFLAFCFPAYPTRAQTLPEQPDTTNPSVAQVDENLPQSSYVVAENSNNPLKHRLLQDSISIPEGEEDKTSKNELQQLIEQIRSIEFKPQDEAPKPIIIVEPAPTAEPNETSSDTQTTEEPVEKEPEFKPQPSESQNAAPLPYEPVADQTLQIIENLSQHPEQLDNPLELGEVLFLSGRPKQAALFYQEALNRKTSEQAGSAQDRAWILFQIANCLQDDDLETAAKMYRQLIAEYPDSPWADLAKAQNRLLDWYQKDKPRMLIAESQF